MPPRKSTEANPSATKGADDDTPGRGAGRSRDGLGIEDLTLPRTMIQRLAKGVLPPNTSINKDALLAIHKSATVFVSYLAASANDRAILANKKTIQPNDVLEALPELEFESFLPRCVGELNVYNNVQCTKRNDYRRKVKQEREAASESAILAPSSRGADGSDVEGGGSGSSPASRTNGLSARERDSPPAAKKARVSLAGDSTMNGHTDLDEDEDEDDEDDGVGVDEDEEPQGSDVDVDQEEESHAGSEEEAEDMERGERYGVDQDEDEAEADDDDESE